MSALRLARPTHILRTVKGARGITAAANASTTSSASSVIPLSNVEAQWENISADEQLAVHQQLEELQKKDWKTLSIDEKKAAYYVAFGPHGPRKPTHPPGTGLKIALSTFAVIGAGAGLYGFARSFAPPPPKTITKEWEEASNQRALEQKMNPITGIASEGYSGPGFVTQK